MIHKTTAILALAASALVGSAHAAVTYVNETFEGGTVNHTIDHTAAAGVGTLTQIGATPALPATVLAGTAFTAGSTTLMGILATGEPMNFTPGGSVPGGKHGFVSNSANRTMTITNPMTLVSDGVSSINVSFGYMLYGLGTSDFTHTLQLAYSALGTFADIVQIATFTPSPATPQDTWHTGSISIASTDVTFADTAKLRLTKLAPQLTSQIVLLDNIVITGVPEPSTTALLGLAGFALLRRRRNQAPHTTICENPTACFSANAVKAWLRE